MAHGHWRVHFDCRHKVDGRGRTAVFERRRSRQYGGDTYL